jgi:putative acetyltransferase
LTQVRFETPQDYPSVYEVNQSAFGRSAEADLVEKLRQAASPTLSLVAEQHGLVVGHIFFSLLTIQSPQGDWTALGLGPVAVLPAYQGQGIGSQLVRQGLQACREAGWGVVVVLGHPWFYPRFGFKVSRPLGITCAYQVPEEAFMVAELWQDALGGRSGVVHFQPAFDDV